MWEHYVTKVWKHVQVARAPNKNKKSGLRHGYTHQDGGVLGVDAVSVDVKAHLGPGLNALTVVVLPDKSLAESRERAGAAQMHRQRCLNGHLEGEAFYKLAAPDSA